MPKPWHQRQKEQGVKLVLSWFTPRKCWKKYHDGEVRYFKHPDSAEGYELAVLEYHSWLRHKKQARPLAAEYEHHIQLFRQCLDWYGRFGTPENDNEQYRVIAELVERMEKAVAAEEALPNLFELLPECGRVDQDKWTTEQELGNHAAKLFIFTFCSQGIVGPDSDTSNDTRMFDRRFGGLGYSLPEIWQERVRQLGLLAAHRKKLPQTVEHHVERFLAFKEMQVRGGVLKARTWGTLKERLTIFTNWIKPGTHVATINGNTIIDFYMWLLQQSWGQERRKGLFAAARQWIRWAWRQDDVELEILPKNIDSQEFVFLTHIDDTGVAKKTRTELLWTPDDFHRTLEIVPEDFQLFLLLMLNCGFTNIDVGTLLKSEIRLDEGRIIRQRTKTRRHTHPPVVNYKLWPRTAKLLRSRLSDDPVLALTNRGGRPLCVSKLVVENGTTREVVWSSLLRRYGQMKKANPKLPDKQMKYLRKTGSSKLRSDRRFLSLDSLYLGHSWVTVADKHYNVFDGQTYQPLDEAIEWLGKEFRLL